MLRSSKRADASAPDQEFNFSLGGILGMTEQWFYRTHGEGGTVTGPISFERLVELARHRWPDDEMKLGIDGDWQQVETVNCLPCSEPSSENELSVPESANFAWVAGNVIFEVTASVQPSVAQPPSSPVPALEVATSNGTLRVLFFDDESYSPPNDPETSSPTASTTEFECLGDTAILAKDDSVDSLATTTSPMLPTITSSPDINELKSNGEATATHSDGAESSETNAADAMSPTPANPPEESSPAEATGDDSSEKAVKKRNARKKSKSSEPVAGWSDDDIFEVLAASKLETPAAEAASSRSAESQVPKNIRAGNDSDETETRPSSARDTGASTPKKSSKWSEPAPTPVVMANNTVTMVSRPTANYALKSKSTRPQGGLLSRERLKTPQGLATAGGALLLLLAVVWQFLPASTREDARHYRELKWILDEIRAKRAGGSTDFSSLIADAKKVGPPIVEAVKRLANNEAPVKQHLLYAARDHLPRMLGDLTKETDSELQFAAELQEVATALGLK